MSWNLSRAASASTTGLGRGFAGVYGFAERFCGWLWWSRTVGEGRLTGPLSAALRPSRSNGPRGAMVWERGVSGGRGLGRGRSGFRQLSLWLFGAGLCLRHPSVGAVIP